MKKVTDFKIKGKKVLVRCDFNVPIKNRKILDDLRIQRAIPTIKFLIQNSAKTILISHLGDPEGKKIEELRLDPIAKRLEKLLGQKVFKLEEATGEKVEKKIARLKEKEVLLLENIRFYPGEEKKDPNFVLALARLGEIFINEAFSVSHRDHASVSGLPKILPSGIGFEFQKEIEVLENFLKNYQKPLVILIGGKKIKDKAPLLKKFLKMSEWILVNHLIKKELERLGMGKEKKILGPVDGENGFDIGPKTVKIFGEKIKIARSIFWNGPFGKIEDGYVSGTKKLCFLISKSKAFSLAGGGDTAEFLNRFKLISKFSFVSTGGGAMLKFLAGEKLPGLEALGYYGNKKSQKSS